MSLDHGATNQPSLFLDFERPEAPPSPVKSARSRHRAAAWESDLARTATYLMGQCRSEDERAFVERLYEKAADEGPDFIHYRSKSAFMNAPRLGIDRNAYARILKALEMIERGIYRQCRDKGKQGIPRTAARVLKTLLGLALQYGEVRPSLEGIGRLACVCKQTVVNCLKVLQLYGFVVVHRRIKRIRTALGLKVVQDTNAYTIQEPQGLGAFAARMFSQRSESKRSPPSSKDSHSERARRQNPPSRDVPDGVFDTIHAQWEAA